jgi:D-alanine--poly(phosphoribitol) ligase subunit 1
MIEAKPFDLDGLLKHLKQTMPFYMIPSRIKFVNSFPENLNGKLDRKSLLQSLLQL